MYGYGMARFLMLAVMGFVLVGLLVCGALGLGGMAFQAGQAQGYATGVVQAGGEGVAPMPYGYYGPRIGEVFFLPLLCCGGLMLLLFAPVLLLPLKVVAFAGERPRHRRRHCGPDVPWPDEMPDEAHEHMKQHFKHGSPCSPGPWMFRHGMRGRRRGSWWTDEEMPDEVKQWFRQRFGHWTEECAPQPEAPAGESAGEPAEESAAEEAE